jgi:tetratricopeptide (TPR) repeat protein
MKQGGNRGLRLALLVFLAASAIRLAYVAQVHDSPFYSILTFDSMLYDEDAHALLEHGFLYGNVYILGPLYVYFLAVMHAAAGHDVAAVMAAQALLGGAACSFASLTGTRMFGLRTGALAGFLAAFYGPLAFYSAEILSEAVLIFVDAVLVWLLAEAYIGGDLRLWFASGLAMGVSAWGKPNILVLLPIMLAMNWGSPSPSDRRKACALLIAGVLLTVLPVTARNIVSGSFAPVTGNLGVNLYIGNNPDATGTFIPLNELIPSSGGAYHLMSPEGSGERMLWEADSLLLTKSLSYVRDDPGGWLMLMLRKAMLFLNAYEIPDMDNYNFLRSQSLLAYLIPSMSLLAPLGLLSAGRNLGQRKARPAAAYLAAYALTFILFFVKARFRILLMPALLIFAAEEMWRLHDLWKTDRKTLRSHAAALLILLVAVNNPAYNASGLEDRGMLNPYNNLGRAYEDMGDAAKSEEYYLKAVAYNPRHYESLNNLGGLYGRMGEYGKAAATLEEAVRLNPDSPYARNNLGNAYYGLGRPADAEIQYRRAAALNPFYYEARANLGAALLAEGRPLEAVPELEAAAAISPADPQVRANLAAARSAAGPPS